MPRRLAVLAVLASLLVAAAPGLGAPPPVEARAYIVLNPATGETLAERGPDRELPMASTTKIMTALLVLERAGLDDRYAVPPEAIAIGGSTGHLVAGEVLSVRDLLTALLVPSGNDAAVTLAVGLAGSQEAFVDMMNARARELGLTHTHFANPHGLDAPGHHSSPADLVKLAGVAMQNPFFRRTVASRRASIPGSDGMGRRSFESENELLDIDPDADGVKTGVTDGAGFALVAHARRESLGVELYLASIGSRSSDARARDAQRLLDYAFSRYAKVRLLAPDAVLGRVEVDGYPGRTIPFRPASGLEAGIRIGGEPLSQTLVAPTEVGAPVEEGQVLGSVTYRQGERIIGRRDVVAAESAGSPGPWDRLRAGLESLIP